MSTTNVQRYTAVSQIPFICKLLDGWKTSAAATATMTGFLGPGLDAGPIIAHSDSYQSICIGSLQPHTYVVTLWCNRLHLTGTVNCWHTPCCLVHRRGYSYVNDSAPIAPGSI